MSFPDKEQRRKCWSSKDLYWKCLDEAGNKKIAKNKCASLENIFKKECPNEWVNHFNRKYDYLKYKERIEKYGNEFFDEQQN